MRPPEKESIRLMHCDLFGLRSTIAWLRLYGTVVRRRMDRLSKWADPPPPFGRFFGRSRSTKSSSAVGSTKLPISGLRAGASDALGLDFLQKVLPVASCPVMKYSGLAIPNREDLSRPSPLTGPCHPVRSTRHDHESISS